MKIFVYCLLLLPFATVVLTAPVRARRESVLSFLNANRNPPSKPVTDKDSEDVSDAQSAENYDTNGFTEPGASEKNGGESRDTESHEVGIPIVVTDNTPSGRKMGMGTDSVSASKRLVQDYDSREQTELNSEEGMMVVAKEDGNLSEKQFIRLSGDKVIDSGSQGANLQGIPRRVNGMLAQGQSREMQDWDSAEENNGQVAAAGNTGDTDETKEFISSETYPVGKNIFFFH
ncbi:hypothetical protein INR49_024202 [Caranx melampygus]|nr:hypothetical protein INR49_024202 [Caranx melampygus]